MPVGSLNQKIVAIVGCVAQVGQRVFIAPLAFNVAGQGQPHACLTDEIKGRIGDGHFFFKHRAVAGPFAQALGQYQGGVTQAQQILE